MALDDLGITACVPARRNRRNPRPHDPALHRQRHLIETLFARLKDWPSIATRHDRCADIVMGAITLAAIVIVWLESCVLIPKPSGQTLRMAEVTQHARTSREIVNDT